MFKIIILQIAFVNITLRLCLKNILIIVICSINFIYMVVFIWLNLFCYFSDFYCYHQIYLHLQKAHIISEDTNEIKKHKLRTSGKAKIDTLINI